MKIKIPYNKINPLSPEKDETLVSLAIGTLALGVQPEPSEDREFVTYKIDNDKLPLNIADLIVSKGCEITEFPLFIEIENKEDPSLEEGMNWIEWMGEADTFYEADGRIFIGTNAFEGKDLSWSELAPVRSQLVLPQDLPKITE